MWSPLLESQSSYFVRGFIAYSFPWSRNFLESLFTVFVLWHGTLSQCDLQCCSKVWDFPVSIAFSWESLAMHILSDLLHTLSCSHYCGVPGNGSAVGNSILRYLVFIFLYLYIHTYISWWNICTAVWKSLVMLLYVVPPLMELKL